jgi:bifunctional non-homologous end joining protein LigD
LKRATAAVVRAPSTTYPCYIAPAQATNIGRPPSGDGWAHEIKHDGFRSQIQIQNREVIVYSKSGSRMVSAALCRTTALCIVILVRSPWC